MESLINRKCYQVLPYNILLICKPLRMVHQSLAQTKIWFVVSFRSQVFAFFKSYFYLLIDRALHIWKVKKLRNSNSYWMLVPVIKWELPVQCSHFQTPPLWWLLWFWIVALLSRNSNICLAIMVLLAQFSWIPFK